MKETVKQLFVKPKGLLALDWSSKTIAKQFARVGLISDPELNRVYRQMLVTTPNLSSFVSGIILHEETVNQNLDSGKSFPEYIASLGIIPGIRADKANGKWTNGEEDITLGIEDLGDRLKSYSNMGIKFTKWRSGFRISDIYPSKEFVEENLNRLVRFALVSVANSLIPVLEPEIELNGNHTTTRCAEVSADILTNLYGKLAKENVDLRKTILKTNMVLPGKDSGVKAEPLEVAEATLRTLHKSVPKEVPGIVFLSGGQTPEEATLNLNEIVKRKGGAPWDLSFSYARALQEEALSKWGGKTENIESAQKALIERLKKVSKARMGEL